VKHDLKKHIKRRAVEDFGIPPERETGIVYVLRLKHSLRELRIPPEHANMSGVKDFIESNPDGFRKEKKWYVLPGTLATYEHMVGYRDYEEILSHDKIFYVGKVSSARYVDRIAKHFEQSNPRYQERQITDEFEVEKIEDMKAVDPDRARDEEKRTAEEIQNLHPDSFVYCS